MYSYYTQMKLKGRDLDLDLKLKFVFYHQISQNVYIRYTKTKYYLENWPIQSIYRLYMTLAFYP